MTKREFLESELFKALPDDGEIVFATDSKLKMCMPLNPLNISLVKECVNEDKLNELPYDVRVHFKPEYRTCLVLDCIPYWILKEKYGIVIGTDDEK